MWIDPSNLTSQWQDSTGTTPVATPGTVADSSNPVGLALDLRLGATALTDPGNHLLQATSTARPLESARVNLLLMKSPYPFDASDDMTDAAVVDATVVNAAGTNTITCGAAADALVRFSKVNPGSPGVSQQLQTGVPYTYSFDIRGVGDAVGKKVYFTAARAGGPNAEEEITLSAVVQRISSTIPASASVTDVYAYVALKGFSTVANLTTGDAIEITNLQLDIGSVSTEYQYADTTDLYSSTGFPIYQKYDGTDDGMATASFAAGTLTSAMDCLIAVRRDAGGNAVAGLYNGVSDATKVFGIAESGSSSGCVGSGAGTPTVWVDGVQLTGGTSVTRDTLNTALTVGDWHILELRGLDLSTWTAVGRGLYTGALLNGAFGGTLLFPSSTSTANRDAARTWLGAKVGLTL